MRSKTRHVLGRDRLQAAEPAFAPVERAERFCEVVGLEFRPHPLGEVQLGIGAFPEQEIGQPLLAAGADDEVDVAQVWFAGDQLGEVLAGEMREVGGAGRGIEDGVARGIIDCDAQV